MGGSTGDSDAGQAQQPDRSKIDLAASLELMVFNQCGSDAT